MWKIVWCAEHFMFAHRITDVFLSLLFNTFFLHGYLPADFRSTAMVAIKIQRETQVTKTITDRLHSLPLRKAFINCILEILLTHLELNQLT